MKGYLLYFGHGSVHNQFFYKSVPFQVDSEQKARILAITAKQIKQKILEEICTIRKEGYQIIVKDRKRKSKLQSYLKLIQSQTLFLAIYII